MMVFRQYDLACLSLYSYLIGDTSTGRAVVVDPQRDVSEYLADAEEAGVRIERVIETHFHADFLSGHLELAAATGAVISYGDVARPDFPIEPLADGQVLSLGDVTLEIRHTPGHTPESISVVVRRQRDEDPWAVLTGDALFIGDVGRPDLLTSVGRTADSLARDLYRSLHEQLLTLPDATLVYPAHGAGSACGKHLSAAAASTIGEQRATNYALAPMTEDQFVEAVTEGQGEAPLYFAFAADANRRERALLDEQAPPPPLSATEAVARAERGAVLLDTRSPEAFASGHVRGSVNVGLDGRFAEYAGDVLRPGQEVVLLGDAGRGEEARVRLARIGFDRVAGAVDDVEAQLVEHPDLAATAPRVTAAEVRAWIADDPDLQVVDVRNPGERAGGAVPGARSIPLARLLEHLAELDPARRTVVYCAGGYRSSIAASTLRAAGFGTVADMVGGYAAWAAAAG
jgi:glyoxylase-like metal-dependent hydrolase (beta-lactamase superfamily II)/rhodanese-related sulfurtransferase